MQPFTKLTAVAAPLEQANIDTDQIIPARFLRRLRVPGYEKLAFHDIRYDADGKDRPDFVLNQAPYRGAKILVTGANFGCGSSREGAVYVLFDYGIRSVIAPSFGDIHFVFNTPYDFKDRFNGEPDYFAGKGEQKGLLLDTNFVADAVNLPLYTANERGAGGGHIRFSMAKGYLNSHISQFPAGTYKKAHAHGPGAHVIIMSGEGYSLMWPEGEEPKRYEWKEAALIVPPNLWFHQHFNTGEGAARYLVFKAEGVAIRNAQGVPKAWISKRLGGDQIDYADEAPRIRQWFTEALAKKGLESRMEKAYQAELGT